MKKPKQKKNSSSYSKSIRHAELDSASQKYRSRTGPGITMERINNFIFLLLVFFLPTQFGKHFFFDFSFLSGVRVDYLAPTLYYTDILITILAVLNWKNILSFFKHKTLLLFLGLLILNIIFAQSIPLAIYRFVKIVEFFVLFSLAKNILKQEKDHDSVEMTKKLLLTLTLSVFVQATLATLQFVNKHSIQGIFYFLGERSLSLSTPNVAKGSLDGVEILRPYATFSHPNSMGGFFILIYFFLLVYKPFNDYRLFKPIILFLTTVLIFLSFSKIIIFTFLILNVFYFLRRFLKKGNCRICDLSKLATIAVLAFFFMNFKSDPLSLEKRAYLINNSFAILKNHLLNGTGLNNYLILQDKIPSRYLYFFNQPVHNILFLFLTEVGIIIGIFAIWQLFLIIKKHHQKEVFLFAILVIFITGSFDHYWLTLQQNFILMAFIFGASFQDSDPDFIGRSDIKFPSETGTMRNKKPRA